MLRSVSGYLFNRLAKVLKQDTEKAVEQAIANNLPTKRGEFNPYQVYKMEHLWTKYFDGSLNRADLTWWEKIDMQLVLHWRKTMRYERMGLLFDDVIDDERPLVIEAINRLPKEIREARERRIAKAFDYSFRGKELPESEWTKPEDDVAYLRPYIAWVEAEMQEADAQKIAINDLQLPLINRAVNGDLYETGLVYKKRLVE